jgi:hypothetical protein
VPCSRPPQAQSQFPVSHTWPLSLQALTGELPSTVSTTPSRSQVVTPKPGGFSSQASPEHIWSEGRPENRPSGRGVRDDLDSEEQELSASVGWTGACAPAGPARKSGQAVGSCPTANPAHGAGRYPADAHTTKPWHTCGEGQQRQGENEGARAGSHGAMCRQGAEACVKRGFEGFEL